MSGYPWGLGAQLRILDVLLDALSLLRNFISRSTHRQTGSHAARLLALPCSALFCPALPRPALGAVSAAKLISQLESPRTRASRARQTDTRRLVAAHAIPRAVKTPPTLLEHDGLTPSSTNNIYTSRLHAHLCWSRAGAPPPRLRDPRPAYTMLDCTVRYGTVRYKSPIARHSVRVCSASATAPRFTSDKQYSPRQVHLGPFADTTACALSTVCLFVCAGPCGYYVHLFALSE